MPEAKTVVRRLEDLKEEFFVRGRGLDEDVCMKLAAFYEADKEIDPIEITPDDIILDGRHRKHAQLLALRVNAKCVVVTVKDKVEALAYALSKNEGGPKPMGEADVVYTIRQMLQSKATEKRVYELLEDGAGYPKAMIRKYLEKAKAQLKRIKLQNAAVAVTDRGLTVKAAAEEEGVDVNDLKTFMRRQSGTVSVKESSDGIPAMKKEISSHTFRMQRGTMAVIKRVVQGYIDGAVNENVAREVLSHYHMKVNLIVRSYEDIERRFNAARRGEMLNWNERLPAEEAAEAARAA